MKQIFYSLIIMTLTLTLCVSCSQEDDLNTLFVGKTWYITDVRLNGSIKGEDLKPVYESGSSAYYIKFTANQFQGTLSNGTSISGTWGADGKDKTINMRVITSTGKQTQFDTNLLSIIKNLRNYDGDANIMFLKQDNANYIKCATKR